MNKDKKYTRGTITLRLDGGPWKHVSRRRIDPPTKYPVIETCRSIAAAFNASQNK